MFFIVRSEPLSLEQLHYNLLFRWFVGLGMDDPIWEISTFSKNRDRFIRCEISQQFFAAVLAIANENGLMSDEHFIADGTLLQAWASHKSFKPKDDDRPTAGGRNAEVDFKKTTRSNETHDYVTDPEARLFKEEYGISIGLGLLHACPDGTP